MRWLGGLFLSLWLACGAYAQTHVQGAHNSTGGGSGTSIGATGSAVGSGHTVVGTCFWGNSATTLNSVTDNQSNTYTVKDSTTASSGVGSASFVLGNITNGPITVTCNFSASTQFLTIIWDEYSGVLAATDPTDGHTFNNQSAPGTTLTSTNITTTTNGDLIYGATWDLTGASTFTAGSGFTIRTTDSTGAPGASEDETQGTAGAVAATFTASVNTDNFTTYVVAIKPAAGATCPNTRALLGAGC